MSPLEFVSCSRLCAKSERRVRVEKPDELCFIISFSYFSQQTVEINSISFFYSSPVQVSPAPTSGKTSQIALSAISCIFIQTIFIEEYFSFKFWQREGEMRLRGRDAGWEESRIVEGRNRFVVSFIDSSPSHRFDSISTILPYTINSPPSTVYHLISNANAL